MATASAVAVLLAVGGGVTYAATSATSGSSGSYVSACGSATHVLRLVDSKRRCPAGYAHVRLAYAPTAVVVNKLATTKKAKVGSFTFTASCHNDPSGHYADLDLTSPAAYVVQGSDVVTGNGALVAPPNNVQTAGAGQISYDTNSLSSRSTTVSMLNDGGATGNLLIIQSGHTLTVTFALFSYNGACSVQAQIAPSA